MSNDSEYPEIPQIEEGVYRHSKSGKLYEVVGISLHSETLEPLVVYRALYDHSHFGLNSLWVRPYAMFVEQVTLEGKPQPRFEYLGKSLEDLS